MDAPPHSTGHKNNHKTKDNRIDLPLILPSSPKMPIPSLTKPIRRKQKVSTAVVEWSSSDIVNEDDGEPRKESEAAPNTTIVTSDVTNSSGSSSHSREHNKVPLETTATSPALDAGVLGATSVTGIATVPMDTAASRTTRRTRFVDDVPESSNNNSSHPPPPILEIDVSKLQRTISDLEDLAEPCFGADIRIKTRSQLYAEARQAQKEDEQEEQERLRQQQIKDYGGDYVFFANLFAKCISQCTTTALETNANGDKEVHSDTMDQNDHDDQQEEKDPANDSRHNDTTLPFLPDGF